MAKMAASAGRVFVVADSSKLDKTALCRFGRLQDWSALVTDAAADRSFLRTLAKAELVWIKRLESFFRHKKGIFMEELKKGLSISLAGPQAERALTAFRVQMKAWDLALPPAEPLVLDFGLGRISIAWASWNAGSPTRCRRAIAENTCSSSTARNVRPAAHHTKHEEYLSLRGGLDVVLDGRSLLLEPGQLLPIAPGHVHSFRGRGNALLLELSMPCHVSDNRFENPRIMEWLSRSANTAGQ